MQKHSCIIHFILHTNRAAIGILCLLDFIILCIRVCVSRCCQFFMQYLEILMPLIQTSQTKFVRGAVRADY